MAKESHSTTAPVQRDPENNPGHRDAPGFWKDWQAFACCIVVCVGAVQYGLDLGAISGFQAMPGFLMVFGFPDKTAILGYGIDTTVQQLISSLMSIGAFIACAGIGPLGRYVSRKWTLVIAIVLNHLAVVLMMVADNFASLYAGRLIIGIANGLFNVTPQLYIHECAPAAYRGSLLGCFNIFIGIGLLIGSIVDNYCALYLSKESYRIPLGLFFILPSILGVALPFIPETPRWLIEHDKFEAARKSLSRLRSKQSSQVQLDSELEAIREALEKERHLADGVAIMDLFRRANIRRTLLSFAMGITLTGTGALLFLGYGTFFFAVAGQSAAFQESVGMTAAGLVATLLSTYLITRLGRRTLLLIGFASQAVCMLIVAAVSERGLTQPVGKAIVAFTIIFIVFYNATCAPYIYLVAGEIPTQRLRGYTLGLSIAIAFFFSWLATYTAPYFINAADLGGSWGPKYGYIWFGSNVIIFVFVYIFIPETKDRTLEEIDEMFEAGIPARKFKGYKCSGPHDHRVQDSVSEEKDAVQHLEQI